MSQSLTQCYLHITFSTKERYPYIDSKIEQELWSYLGGVCGALECVPIRVGGYRDLVHICCLLSKKISLIHLLEEIKKRSSKWIKTKGREYEKFYWQSGYSVFSVNPSDRAAVVKYIDNQREHHRHRSFKEEMLAFLKKYGTEYDERYLWD
jgi:REP element-mobilizing transposase RayT